MPADTRQRTWRRRQMLETAIALPITAAVAASASAAASEAISLGFSLYGTKRLPLDESLRACAAAGFGHVELCLNPGFPTEPAAFPPAARKATADLLRDLGLAVPCLMIQIPLVCDDATQRASLELIGTAAAVGRDLVPDDPPILETVLGGSPARWDEQKAGMLQRLEEWAARAEREGVVVAIKAHVGSAVNSPERLRWLLDETGSPAIQAAYDFSHFELQGIDLEQSLTQLLPRTRFIHVKDSAGDPNRPRFLLPGEGRTDYVRYFRLLRQLQYAGPVCVEVSGHVSSQPDYDPRAAIVETSRVLARALADAAS